MFQTQEENFISKEIGGVRYDIHRFSPTPALKLSTRLAKFIGPAIAKAVEDFQKANKEGKKMTKADLNLSGIIMTILPNLEEDFVTNTMKDLISCVSINGTELKNSAAFESHFKGKLGHMLPLVGAIVEYQFSDFLSGLLTENSL
jgi:hypothetical protein